MIAPVEHETIETSTRHLSAIAWVVAGLASAVLVGSIAIVSSARGDERRPYWFNLYASDHGAGFAKMRAKLKMGPFSDLAICYALGAIGMEELNKKYPDKDFAGGCVNGEILDLRDVADHAFALLPKDGAAR